MEGIRFRFHYRHTRRNRVESLHVRVPFLGRHSVHTALRAAALGLVEGLKWDELLLECKAYQANYGWSWCRASMAARVIDDTYNASPASTVAALNLLADLEPW